MAPALDSDRGAVGVTIRGARLTAMRTLGFTTGLVLVASVAHAAPIAQVADDLDGDGTAGSIELTADGMLHVGDRPRGEVRVAAKADRGRVTVARRNGRPLILVEVSNGRAEEAIIVEGDRGRWQVSARFPLGGVGLDADYAIGAAATPNGIYRYQTRSDIRRCDGKPTYLFPELFEPTSRKFIRAIPPDGDEGQAPRLAARVDATPAGTPVVYRAHAASTQPGAGDAGGLTIPTELDDGRPDTAWHEDLGSDGRRQFFTFEPRVGTARAKQLRILAGAQGSTQALKANNRVHELAIVSANGTWQVELPDVASQPLGTAYMIDLPASVTGCVSVVLLSMYGGATNQTIVPELEVFADGERGGGGGEAMLAKVVADGKDSVTSAAAALARRGASAVAAIDAELAKTNDAGARRRLINALVKIQDPVAAPALARAATEGWVRDQDLIDVIDALARNGMQQELHDLAAKGGLDVDARVAAASRMTATGAGFPLLVALAGSGPREVRRAVIDRLGLAPLAPLTTAATTQSNAAAAGDVWRAITRRSRSAPNDRAASVEAMTTALATATDYERRYRLVDGLAALGDATALQTLEAMLRGLPEGADAAALRTVAVKAIGNAPRPEAIKLVLGFATDRDPGVRLAVLSSLAAADADASNPWHAAGGPDGIDRVIVTALSSDTWPEVRRRAATTLGARCQRPGPASALTTAVTKDKVIDVRTDALTALVQCHAAGIADLLARTWDDGDAPLELRTHAVDLAVALADPKLGAVLVGKFARWRGAAIESAEALALAQSSAAAIGRLDAPGAAKILLEALDDSAFPEVVSAAALALGALGPACPPAAKVKLNTLARSDDQAAVAAKRALAQCGK